MLFGLINIPVSCQKLVNNVFRNFFDKYVITYLNDILIYSKTLEQHKKDMQQVLQCFAKVNLKLEPEKCEFHKKSVKFLGYIIYTYGIEADLKKVKALLD